MTVRPEPDVRLLESSSAEKIEFCEDSSAAY